MQPAAKPSQATGQAPPPPPCHRCREIKARRYTAVRQGDRETAEAMVTAMGVHLRAAHS
ncbi:MULTISPECIES: hypothetical protein [Streptomyces]|uniref:Uncharacterized protein n=1 Tax=Streptomyces luteosporeus TaxID=173856 RepID=A0ABN3TPV0_9ACTN